MQQGLYLLIVVMIDFGCHQSNFLNENETKMHYIFADDVSFFSF